MKTLRLTPAELSTIQKRLKGVRTVRLMPKEAWPTRRDRIHTDSPDAVAQPQRDPGKLRWGCGGKLPTVSEHAAQVFVIRWWQAYAALHKIDPRLLFAIPNGGARHPVVAGKLKAEGVQPGVPDLFLALPADVFHGAFFEMKSLTGNVSASQRGYIELLRRHDYNVLTCFGAADAIRAIEAYCKQAHRLTAARRSPAATPG